MPKGSNTGNSNVNGSGNKSQKSLNQISKEMMDLEDLKRRMIEEEEEMERERKRKLAECFMLAYMYQAHSEEIFKQYDTVFNKRFKGTFNVPSKQLFSRFCKNVKIVDNLLKGLDDFNTKYHMNHVNIHGIQYLENQKMMMTAEEKKTIKRETFNQDDLNVILYATSTLGEDYGERDAVDAVEQYAQGNTKPLANIMGNAILKCMDLVKKGDTSEKLMAATILSKLIVAVENHEDMREAMPITEKEFNKACGISVSGILNARALESRSIIDRSTLEGEHLQGDILEDVANDIIVSNVVSKYSPEKIGSLGVKVSDWQLGVVPASVLTEVDEKRNSMSSKDLVAMLKSDPNDPDYNPLASIPNGEALYLDDDEIQTSRTALHGNELEKELEKNLDTPLDAPIVLPEDEELKKKKELVLEKELKEIGIEEPVMKGFGGPLLP